MVLMVSRLERHKGVDVLLRSVPHVLAVCPDARFVIAGPPHPSVPKYELDNLVTDLGIGNHVQFAGQVPDEELAALYRRASVCVLPSYYEAFGLVAAEAMAFGVPVVATSAGGLPEVVEDGVTGILVPPGDVRALAEAIVRVLDDPYLRQRMGKAGRSRVLSRFAVDRVVHETLAVYRQVQRPFQGQCVN